MGIMPSGGYISNADLQSLGLIMNSKKTYNTILLVLGLMSLLLSCSTNEEPNNNLKWKIEGPYYRDVVIERFNLETIDRATNSKNHFLLTIKNPSRTPYLIKTSEQNQVFPDSSHFHSFRPHSASMRRWIDNIDEKPNKELQDTVIKCCDEYNFWFISYMDNYVDSLFIHFSVTNLDKLKNTRQSILKTFDSKAKPHVNYELIESDLTKIMDTNSIIRMNIEGPYTYSETNNSLGEDIEYGVDNEEVFIAEIENLMDEEVLIETWPNREILMDSIYYYSTFTQTAKEKGWITKTTKKNKETIDTLRLRPNESKKFWTSFDFMTPSVDSIAFFRTFNTETYEITTLKLYEVKKTTRPNNVQ